MAKRFKKKIIRINKSKFITDKALVNFIHQHSTKETINFPKINIPSYSKFLENEKKGIKPKGLNENCENYTIFKNQNNNKMPKFGLSLFNNSFNDEKSKKKFKFESFIFPKYQEKYYLLILLSIKRYF